ncbi:HEXXH motif-containing putative peptide modification protein [Nocardioides sp. W7]|uniref:aKG-HExxH-type peptide beta-hydroxylase n=1 Tax=Nocardioides sp. W7 TaxID=2931390 RepID=UPI001FD0F4F0|nr:HEXXH motif-containing putative peptide modification protein [Nocardioides sp. W7]
MSQSTRFAGVAALDVRPRDCFTVYEGLAASVRTSYANLATLLEKVETTAGRRLSEVLAVAPQVVTNAAGYCWLNAVYAVIAGNDRDGLDRLLAGFSRFEAAAAVSAGVEYDGVLPSSEPVALPGTGLVVASPSGFLRIRSGVPAAEHWSMPTIAGLRIDGFEPLLRSPRSMSQFAVRPGSRLVSAAAAEELAAARELAATIAPTLFERYLSDVVPLEPEPGVAHAGTDDAAPWAVYLSFGREPTDLVAALAHEESHALVQTLAKLVPDLLPDSAADVAVPWKPGVRRSLSGVLHGLIAFGRTATVRSRAARAGIDGSANAEALDREHGWLAEVTGRLLDGQLGELPDELSEWLVANLRGVDSPPPDSTTGLSVLAGDQGSGPGFGWLLLDGADVRAAANELYGPLMRTSWTRGVPGYPHQDRGELDVGPPALLSSLVPALVADRTGVRLELTSVKAHRLRNGDRITAHSDAHHADLSHRLVLGLTPHDLRSGDLRLLTTDHDPTIGTQPQFGQGLLFDVARSALHEVTTNLSPYPRYTVIASYRTAT